jgi:hypothetical protein
MAADGLDDELELDPGLDSALDRAHAALRCVEAYADLDPDQRLTLMSQGVSIGKAQAAYDRHAIACGVVAIADALSLLVDMLDELAPVQRDNPAPNGERGPEWQDDRDQGREDDRNADRGER